MKYLSDIMEKKQTALFKKTGTFFAFSQEQLNEQTKPNTKYVNCGNGMITEKPHVKTLLDGLDKIYTDSIKTDLKLHGKKNVVLRELENHECFYTGDIFDCVKKLEDYPNISESYILKIYHENRSKHNNW